MKTYFAVLKGDVRFSRIKKQMSDEGLKVIKYYPKLKIVEFESIKDADQLRYDFFKSVEEEKSDFSV